MYTVLTKLKNLKKFFIHYSWYYNEREFNKLINYQR